MSVVTNTVVLLPPLKEDSRYKDEIEKRIRDAFKKLLYQPVLRALDEPASRFENSRQALIKAIASGKISHQSGTFRGSFSAAISKELKNLGAKWDDGVYRLPLSSIPRDVRNAIEASEKRFQKKLASIDSILSKVLPEKIAEQVKTSDLFSSAIWQVETELSKSLKDLRVMPELTREQRQEIADKWANNLNRYIQDFAQDEIKKLRTDVARNVFAGNRYEKIISTFQISYGVSERKAKFLARQETNLLMAQFKATRYTAAGSDDYVWRCVVGSSNHPVRPSHKVLDGKIFSWNTPPITTGPDEPARRNNPGEDYGCRCFAIPRIKF